MLLIILIALAGLYIGYTFAGLLGQVIDLWVFNWRVKQDRQLLAEMKELRR